MCHMSYVTCHMSRIMCHMSQFFFGGGGQSGEAYRWRVCYQRVLSRLLHRPIFVNICHFPPLSPYLLQNIIDTKDVELYRYYKYLESLESLLFYDLMIT